MADRIVLGAEPASVGRARRFCAGILEGWHAPDATVDVVTLLVSELVTNVVLHAGTPCELAINDGPPLRVEVADGSTEPPIQKHYDTDAGSGRGLHLLEVLSDRFGTDLTPTGKMVWFEVSSPR
jgi:anti-sigma regulatory factor (Ser/Thr protein kinase)